MLEEKLFQSSRREIIIVWTRVFILKLRYLARARLIFKSEHRGLEFGPDEISVTE